MHPFCPYQQFLDWRLLSTQPLTIPMCVCLMDEIKSETQLGSPKKMSEVLTVTQCHKAGILLANLRLKDIYGILGNGAEASAQILWVNGFLLQLQSTQSKNPLCRCRKDIVKCTQGKHRDRSRVQNAFVLILNSHHFMR